MPFTLRVWFSGLCMYIANKGQGPERTFNELCVVLPDASGNDWGTSRHYADICYPKRVPLPAGAYRMTHDPKRVIVEIKRSRVTFDFVEELPVQEGFDYAPEDLIDFSDLAGTYADDNLDIVSPNPPHSVVGQVVLDRGYSRIDSLAAITSQWTLPGTLTGAARTVRLSEPRYIEVPNLRSATMYVTDTASGRSKKVKLEARPAEVVDILVSNRCDGCRMCLEWRLEEGRLQLVQLDDDFYYHYRLLHDTTIEALNNHDNIWWRLDSDDLPYPVPERILIDWPLCCLPVLFLDGPKRVRFHIEGIGSEPKLRGLGRFGIKDGVSVKKMCAQYLHGVSEELLAKIALILEIVLTAVGTGAGSDCLPTGSGFRFLDTPTERSKSQRSDAALRRREEGDKAAPQLASAGSATARQVEVDLVKRTRRIARRA